jgi:hypothetical protein
MTRDGLDVVGVLAQGIQQGLARFFLGGGVLGITGRRGNAVTERGDQRSQVRSGNRWRGKLRAAGQTGGGIVGELIQVSVRIADEVPGYFIVDGHNSPFLPPL